MSKYRQMAGPATCWAGIPAAEKEVWGDFGDRGNDRMQEKQLETNVHASMCAQNDLHYERKVHTEPYPRQFDSSYYL